MKLINDKNRAGFTLVETVIAMGIITIMITAFLAAFGPAVQGIRKSISAKEANRLASSLEYELSVLRPPRLGEEPTYPTAFAKAYDWIEDSLNTTKNDFVIIYQYRGNPNKVRADGTLEPFTPADDGASDDDAVPGQDYVIQSVVRRIGDPEVEEELEAGVVEGRVFYVRMKQLVFDNGALTLTTNPGEIVDPKNPSAGFDPDDHTGYPEAVIAFQAEFYVLKSSINRYVIDSFEYVDDNGDGHPDATGKPVFTRNMAVRR